MLEEGGEDGHFWWIEFDESVQELVSVVGVDVVVRIDVTELKIFDGYSNPI